MKGHGKIPCICQWCGRPKFAHNGQPCQPQAPFLAARESDFLSSCSFFECLYLKASSASKGKVRETFQTPESQSISLFLSFQRSKGVSQSFCLYRLSLHRRERDEQDLKARIQIAKLASNLRSMLLSWKNCFILLGLMNSPQCEVNLMCLGYI